jgi:hypothetical protein
MALIAARLHLAIASPRKTLNARQYLASYARLNRIDVWKMERAKGFEPSTPTLARLCSTPELRPLTGVPEMAG